MDKVIDRWEKRVLEGTATPTEVAALVEMYKAKALGDVANVLKLAAVTLERYLRTK